MEGAISCPDDPAMTSDEVSMERSKSFVQALQELKDLGPQLYSAAEYCEKSYLHSEQKQMVLDNLKDYAVRALVNAVDHLGTVASKLTDVFEQQSSDISTMELKASCLNQQILTCRTYTEKEGLRQQELSTLIPRHHKHYILPNSVSKRVHFSPLGQADARQAISLLQPSDSPASKSLSWHLGSGNRSALKGTSTSTSPSSNNARTTFTKTSGVFHLTDSEQSDNKRPLMVPAQVLGGAPSNMMIQTYVSHMDSESPKSNLKVKAFEKPRQEIIRAPIRSKNMLSAFFVKQKTVKLKAGYVS